jgi:F-type H+-transporting ATPase subunit c
MANKVFAGLLAVAIMTVCVMPAFAQEKEKKSEAVQVAEAAAPVGKSASYVGLALAFGLGLAAFGGALGQSNAIGKAVDAVARQPEAGGRIQGMMIIGLALIETLVIYMLLICFMWGDKVGH